MSYLLKRLAVIGFGIVLAVLFLELGFRLIPEPSWKAVVGKSPSRYVLYQTDREIGWVHVPHAESNWQGYGEFDVDIKMNSRGLRGREYSYEKPAGTFRILLLGDSFTEGIQVPVEDLFSTKLETCLAERAEPAIEVINTGVTGYSPGDELLFFLNEGVNYRPDLVLVAIFAANDAIKDMGRDVDDHMIQSFGGYQFYLDEQGRLQQRWLEWASPEYEISPFEQFLRRNSALYYIFNAPDSRVREEVDDLRDDWLPEAPSPRPVLAKANDYPDYVYDENLIIFAEGFPDNPDVPPRIREWWRLFEAIIAELKNQVEARDMALAATIIPRDAQTHPELYYDQVARFKKRYDALEETEWDLSAPNQAILRVMEAQNIPALDLLPGFQTYAETHDDLLYFEQDIHFTARGHQLAADLLCDWLIEDGLVP